MEVKSENSEKMKIIDDGPPLADTALAMFDSPPARLFTASARHRTVSALRILTVMTVKAAQF